jgi:hypothetical protein
MAFLEDQRCKHSNAGSALAQPLMQTLLALAQWLLLLLGRMLHQPLSLLQS